MTEMRQWNSDRVVDLGGAGEGGIEVLPVELAHDLESDFAWNLPVEFPAGEIAARLAADVDGERRRRGVEEVLGLVVGDDDPSVVLQGARFLAEFCCHVPSSVDEL